MSAVLRSFYHRAFFFIPFLPSNETGSFVFCLIPFFISSSIRYPHIFNLQINNTDKNIIQLTTLPSTSNTLKNDPLNTRITKTVDHLKTLLEQEICTFKECRVAVLHSNEHISSQSLIKSCHVLLYVSVTSQPLQVHSCTKIYVHVGILGIKPKYSMKFL